MKDWFAIVEEDTGRLYSVGSIIASILPLGMIKIPIDGPPTAEDVWDEHRQRFTQRLRKIII